MKRKSKVVHPAKKRKITHPRSNKANSDAIPITNPNPWTQNMEKKEKVDAIIVHTIRSASAKFFFLTLATYFLAKLFFLVYYTADVLNINLIPVE